LPPIRHAWLLIVDGISDPSRAGVLAEALGVDLATARQVALAPNPRIVLRADERAGLDERAARVQGNARVRALVVGRQELLALLAPSVAVAALRPRVFSATSQPAWLGPPGGAVSAEHMLDATGISLAVPGDVVVRRYRVGVETRRGSTKAVKVAGERRVAVLDLHGPDTFVRLALGVTDLQGVPGHDPHSALRSMRALPDGIRAWWPEILVLAPRTCRLPDAPTLDRVAAEPDGLEIGGWASWEEHTRLCRLLHFA
jgi:hypothetical protein